MHPVLRDYFFLLYISTQHIQSFDYLKISLSHQFEKIGRKEFTLLKSRKSRNMLKIFLMVATLVTMANLCDDDDWDLGLPPVVTQPGSGGVVEKPVVFVNNGSQNVTAMVNTYIPEVAGVPVPINSTVVAALGAPGLHTNPSASLSLPLGTYTFCYQWEDQDRDGDGFFDLYHIIDSRPVTLDINDSDSFELAETVTIAIHADDYNRIAGGCSAPLLASTIPTPAATVAPFPTTQSVSSNTAITNVWLEHNVEYQNQTSLFIHTNFQIARSDSTRAWIVVGFWFADGSYMQGVEADFTTQNGQAATWAEVSVDYEVTTWDDLVLYIPASALRSGNGVYATVEIWDQDSGEMLSQWVTESFDVY